MNNLFALSIVFAISSHSFSQTISSGGTPFTTQLNTITTAVPFLNIGVDARAASMGDAGVATSADVHSFHWNTSKLVFSDKKAEFGFSYSPWLKQLVDNVHLVNASGYTKLGDRHVIGGSFTLFRLGQITFTNSSGVLVNEFNPYEYNFLGGYAFKLSDRTALGINGKFVYSNLTNGISSGTVATRPGIAIAGDISYTYLNQDICFGERSGSFSIGTNISNMGNKMAYTAEANRSFIPANLRIGTALRVDLNTMNSLSATIDFNKLLVPTSPIRDGSGQIIAGRDNNVGTLLGMIQSFYDAPGNIIVNPSGSIAVEKGSRFKEELNEIMIGGGFEYLWNNRLEVRAGYFHEARNKGDRKYFTLGAGVHYAVFSLDVSYLAALKRTNPLANTLRFSFTTSFG